MKAAMKQATLALVLGLAAFGTAGNAQATGTPVGTQITNTATFAFNVGGIAQTPKTSLPAFFKVDRKINLTVARTDTALVVVNPGQATATLTFTVTNQGNDSQDYALSVDAEVSGTPDPFGGLIPDNFNGTGMAINVAGGGNNIINLAPDAVKTVTVTFAIPSSQVDKDVASYGLIATTKLANSAATGAVVENILDGSGVYTVFADGSGDDDVARDAKHSTHSACIVHAPVLSITKTATIIWDPVNFNVTSPRAIPGAFVQYAITISNGVGATNTASLTTITDTLNAATLLDPDLMNKTLGTATPTPDSAATMGFKVSHTSARPTTSAQKYYTTGVADGDGVDVNGSIITVDFTKVLPVEAGYTAGELKPGESVTVIFNIKIS